jgi:putative flippase GtrA
VNALAARVLQSRFLRFLIVGGFGFVVAEAALWVMIHEAGANSTVAWLVSFACAVTFTWWGNRNLTFADHKASGAVNTLVEYGKFVVSNALGGAINFAVFKALLTYAPQPLCDPLVALACGVVAGLVFNFTMSKLLVFRT